MKTTAKIIADSLSKEGARITTMELTHRVFSRNAMSSRAIPAAKMIAQVRNDPVIPQHLDDAIKQTEAVVASIIAGELTA